MPRFFVTKEQITPEGITIFGEDAKHISKVLRAKCGEEITVCDGAGMDYQCEITAVGETVETKILSSQTSKSEPSVEVTLFQGLPKGEKMELILQKCVELGIHTIVPVATEFSIVKLDKKEEKKIQRWQKIAEAAAKQSGRGRIPSVERVMNWKEALSAASQLDGVMIPYEKEQERGLRSFLQDFRGKRTMGIFIGPEGGFSEQEIAAAQQAGIVPVTLGKRILRTETAGMTALAIALYELEEGK